MKTPDISVIICTYNRSHALRQALDALAAQTLPASEFEVIVIDDGSPDDTPTVFEAARKQMPNLRTERLAGNSGIGRGANTGARLARGSRLLFTDDDCIPEPGWVAALAAALEHESIVAGSIISPRNDYIQWSTNVAHFYPFMGRRPAGPIRFLAGANMGFTRACFDALGGFEEGRRMAADTEMILRAQRAGYRLWYVPGAVVLHNPQRNRLLQSLAYSMDHSRTTIRMRQEYRDLLGTPLVLRSRVLLALTAPFLAAAVTAGVYLRHGRWRFLLPTLPLVYAHKLAWCAGAVQGLGRLRKGVASE